MQATRQAVQAGGAAGHDQASGPSRTWVVDVEDGWVICNDEICIRNVFAVQHENETFQLQCGGAETRDAGGGHLLDISFKRISAGSLANGQIPDLKKAPMN